MIIDVTKTRRLKGYRYGWEIQQRRQRQSGKNKGEWYWAEDRPAYPASLGQGLEMILMREIKDAGDCGVGDLPARVKLAIDAMRDGIQKARTIA